MKTRYIVPLALLAGIAIGAVAVQGLHAQAQPPAYVIAMPNPADADAYAKNYAAHIQATIEPFGGHYLVRGGKRVVFNGTPPNVVVIAFDNIAKAEAWRNSAAYQAVVPARDKAIGNGTYASFAVEGVSN
jgi:uncharacterized protein (DUF1330 family)